MRGPNCSSILSRPDGNCLPQSDDPTRSRRLGKVRGLHSCHTPWIARGSGKARYSVTFVPYLIGSAWRCRYRLPPRRPCALDSSPRPYDFHSSVDKFVEKNPVQQDKRLRLNDSYLSASICSILPVRRVERESAACELVKQQFLCRARAIEESRNRVPLGKKF